TPYMDALATEGVLFREAYSPACVCAPSRAAILSGQHPARLNFTTVSGGAICPQPGSLGSRMMAAYHNRRLEVDETTLPGVLATNGYFNGHIGKWHLDGPGALDHRFHYSDGHRGATIGMPDRLTGFATTNAADPYQLQDINGQASTNGYAYDQTTENALDFLDQAVATNKPFFCYFATYLVHAPWHQRTERLLKKYSERMGYAYPLDGSETFAEGQNNPYYAAMVETFDYNMHRVVSYLKDTDDPRWPGHKLIENTYVFVTSDNGGMEVGDANGKVTDNYPLDQGKIHQEEGGTRVPFFAVGPGISSNVVSDVMITGLDFMPTLLSLAGISVPDGLDGLDLSTLLLTDPQDEQWITNNAGEVRDTMYWHFPHSSQDNGTIRKGGWKLFRNYDHVNNASKNPHRLYQLYDTNGIPVDREEVVDLWDTETNVTAALAAELDAWLVDVAANTPFYNPKYTSGTLPNQGLVPVPISNGGTGSVVWVEYETNRAEVIRVDLLYTLEGNSVNQDWFRMPASITVPGRAEATAPEGATHYVFNLIDENNFLVSYPDVGTTGDGIPDSAFAFSLGGGPYVNPGPQDTIFSENFSTSSLGTSFVRDSVGFQIGGSSAWAIDSGKLSNTSLVNSTVSEGAAGVIIDLASLEDPSVSEFTLHFDYTMAEYIESLYVHVWGYVDHSSTPGTSIMNLGAQDGNAWENASPAHMTGYNFGNSNGVFLGSSEGVASDAAISLSGFSSPDSYAETFDLSVHTSAPNTLGAYDYLAVGFARSIAGSAPAVTIDNVKVTVPTSDPYAQWAYDTGLDALPDDSSGDLNRVTTGGLARDDEGWHKVSDSEWTVVDGVMANTSSSGTPHGRVSEGPIARIFDLSAFSSIDSGQLALRFEYDTAAEDESLFAHLWGYVDVRSVPGTPTMNLGASNGNAWESSEGAMMAYNLGRSNGVFTGTAGLADDAAVNLTGASGPQVYSNTFDLSAFTTAPATVDGYDYLVIGFTREATSATAPSVAISNVVLAVPGGDTILNFVRALPPSDLMADPDHDRLVNLAEYALGGSPTGGTDIGIHPFAADGVDGRPDYIYRRRRDAAARGLTYTVECTSNLVPAAWSTNGSTETGSAAIDSDFQNVTNRVDTGDAGFVRLKIED
ncbi:MAG: sulfatase-like hydrolase/transferase, partial [Verrucomicrobia bacterium]|nr:sulfatase-like hydrolase/transferase [Verrucomicrobiota bacterium]